MNNVQLSVGGRDVPAQGGAQFSRANPVTGEVVTRAAAATATDGVAAAEAAARALPAWSALGPSERRARLNGAADLVEARAAEFARVVTAETGATGGWGQFNVHVAAGMLREAAAMTTQIGGEVIPSDVPGNFAMALRQPAGVVLGIAPWNAPVILGVRAVAMPLACGNTVILKGSEVCPATHRLIATLLIEAGMGEGVVNYICHDARGAGAVAEAMIAHPAVRRVNFTGSTRVGRLLAVTAAQHLKPILLELGGKAPLVVLEDADVDAAVNATVFGAFAHSGQICMSTERVIVHEKVADEFARRLAARVAALPVGDPDKGEFVLGSVVGLPTVERVRRLVDAAVASGAKLLCGGEARGTLMPGIVVDHVTPQMELFREESFGPQVSITRVKSDDEAVQLANDTEYGLAAAVFSRDLARALGVARRIHSGICHINAPTVHDEPQMPFGGTKASGYGRFGGKAGVEAFTELRWISLQTTPRHYPF
ncbi:MAG: aldehyde dehydrogenase [Gammaproteobacteria bacterium]|nr:aldehyde dehydrogenase [Gammaproteobacteria bacterium]